MKRSELDQWQQAVDVIEDENRDSFDFEAPALNVGESWTAPDGRIWRKVPILYGATGGRWCYWKKIVLDKEPEGGVVVDRIFNGWSPFFAGMLRIPYDGHVPDSLMLTKEGVIYCEAPHEAPDASEGPGA